MYLNTRVRARAALVIMAGSVAALFAIPAFAQVLSDSLAQVSQATQNVTTFLHTALPWLGEGITAWLASAIVSLPVIPVVFASESLFKIINLASPMFYQYLGKWLERWSGLINPILAAAIAAGFFKNAAIGLTAGGVWGMIHSILRATGKAGINLSKATTTPEGMKRAGYAVAIALALTFALCGPASAAPVTQPVTRAMAPGKGNPIDTSRFHYLLALTNRWQAKDALSFRGISPETGVKGGIVWAWNSHVVVPASVWRQISDKSNAWQGEAGIGLTW